MIDYINAIVVQKGLGYIIADCNNIGYRLLVSQNTSYELELEKRQMIYTHLIVKEDGMTLIGFDFLIITTSLLIVFFTSPKSIICVCITLLDISVKIFCI